MNSPDKMLWVVEIKSELNYLSENNTWEIVSRALGQNIIKNRWIFKVKKAPNEQIPIFKARLVAKGYSQVHDIN